MEKWQLNRMKRAAVKKAAGDLGRWEDQIKLIKLAIMQLESALTHAEAQRELAMMHCKDVVKGEY